MPNLENMLHNALNPHKSTPRSITNDGRLAPVQGFGGATALAFFITIVVLSIFLYFYLSPILRNRRLLAPYFRRLTSVELDPELRERRSLVNWMRGSNGRFIATEGNNTPTAISSFFRLFAPSSVYRTVGANTKLAQLPQAYTSQPNSPTPQYALSLSPNKSPSKYSIPMHVPGQQNLSVPTMSPRRPAAPPSYALPPSLHPPTKVPFVPGVGLGLDPETVVRPCSAPRSVSTNSILHPPAPYLPTPSQAVVCESDSAAALGPTRRIFSVERQAGDSTGSGLSGLSGSEDSSFTSIDGDSQVPLIHATGSWEEQMSAGVSATESRSLTEDSLSTSGGDAVALPVCQPTLSWEEEISNVMSRIEEI